jgi:hypothetical protein
MIQLQGSGRLKTHHTKATIPIYTRIEPKNPEIYQWSYSLSVVPCERPNGSDMGNAHFHCMKRSPVQRHFRSRDLILSPPLNYSLSLSLITLDISPRKKFHFPFFFAHFFLLFYPDQCIILFFFVNYLLNNTMNKEGLNVTRFGAAPVFFFFFVN